MSAIQNASFPEARTPTTRRRTRRLTLGIVPRLSFAFVAVSVLAITANLIAEHGARIIETTEYPVSPLRVTQPPGPATRPAPTTPIAAPTSTAFLPAFEHADQILHERVEADTADHRTAWNRASQALLATLHEASAVPGGGKSVLLVRLYLEEAAGAIGHADARRADIDDYRRKLTQLESMLAQAIDHGWKIFGRIIARQSLIGLTRDLQAIEERASTPKAFTSDETETVVALREAEAAFASDLKKSSDGLRHSQGADWEAGLGTNFLALATLSTGARDADDKVRHATDRLSRTAGQIRALASITPPTDPRVRRPAEALARPVTSVQTTPLTPLRSPPATPVARHVISTVPASQDVSVHQRVVWITIAVLASLLATSISTILSIVRPVRRLIDATRLLSAGSVTQVARGGIKELDALTVAFNDMAEQLVAARAVGDAYQATLEQRVSERTLALQHLAEHDELTELPNRRLLLQGLTRALQSAAEHGNRVGVFFLDLDNFKNINDSMGHEFGDQLLLSVAQRLSETAATFGFAARLGGDEFTILYPGAPSIEAIVQAGEAILHAFHKPLAVGERALTISASIGASIYPDHEQRAEALLRAADAALFRAKALGRSQLHIFSPDLVAAALAKFDIEQGLRRALEQGEFELLYQPEVNLASLEPVLVEALVRWRTPDGQLLAPDAFFAVAEESGLIMELSDWVVRTAIATAAHWYHGAWPKARVAINVSPRQLLDGRFVDRVLDLLEQHRLPAHCIEIELTENILQTVATTIDSLRRFRASGVAIALDDFGTGYSSFSSIELLPLTRVKLDRSLIACVDTNPASRAIASAIIGLCRDLGFEITAEGVERPEQLAMLMGNRATHIQGFLLSRPVAADMLLAELAVLPARLESLLLSMPTTGLAFGPLEESERSAKLRHASAS
jgi:diguanylate cyclase (GGDEF)-like protein